ncbi:MAG: metallophosphoesterase family protein [Paludibacteraceae bacterium]|nr:metallophosphoesterase family protein [Paludibacteraceae bacterium]
MKRIGLLSDTHGYWDEKYKKYFESCDEIWHAGDIGSEVVAQKLAEIKPLRAVHGNIDGQGIRALYPQHLRFTIEGVDVWMTHIGGYPGKYAWEVKPEIFVNPPKLFVCGHSHILKVMFDNKIQTLCINPGAAGKYGIHKIRTLIRFSIDGNEIKDLEAIEIGKLL